jgi:DNA-binding LacI/PurR family transcriptional regulator
MEEKTRISDIAQQSGVSTATVSLVLNNKPGVSQPTRLRVLEVAERLEYPIKPINRTRMSDRLDTIGMVVKTDPIPPQANPFYSKVIVGIEDVCRRNGINLLFATLPVDENNHPLVERSISNST